MQGLFSKKLETLLIWLKTLVFSKKLETLLIWLNPNPNPKLNRVVNKVVIESGFPFILDSERGGRMIIQLGGGVCVLACYVDLAHKSAT